MELMAPALDWHDDTPYATAYGDVYFSAADGLAEAGHVFVRGNDLPQRMMGRESFVVAETGFGTGLNFLALWQAWQAMDEPRPRLHYITTELHPLSMEQMEQAHAHWPQLQAMARAMRASYPPAIAGAHRRWLADGRIQIDYLWGDAAHCLAQHQAAEAMPVVDAWFLDGFAPSRNPGLWHEALYRIMADKSTTGTTLASFTAAGDVRRGLAAVGFAISKRQGYGRKREMIVGQYQGNAATKPVSSEGRHAIVIGAGIAGISSAWRLVQQGYRVTLCEAGETPCAGASGNPACAITPYYVTQWAARSRQLASGFYHLQHVVQHLRERGHELSGADSGILMLDLGEHSRRTARLHRWQEDLDLPHSIRRKVNAREACAIANVPLAHGGWYYPQGGWLSMRILCAAMLADAGDAIDLRCNTPVIRLQHGEDRWQVHTADGQTQTAPLVVIASAAAASQLVDGLMLEVVHGQIICFDAPPCWQSQRGVIHAGHALIPMADGRLSWGASFRHGQSKPVIEPDDTEHLLRDLKEAFAPLAEALDPSTIVAWAQLRCKHRSRMPVIGSMPGQPEGLYVHVAHGSRGMLTGTLPFGAGAYALPDEATGDRMADSADSTLG